MQIKIDKTFRVAGCILFALVFVSLGCKTDPLKKVQVTGKVTFDGKACPGPGRITFSPTEVAEGLPLRPASGEFQEDGIYTATSFRPGDGVVPGTYRVSVACYDASMLSGAPGDAEFKKASYVGDGFQSQELVIEPGSGPIEFNLDVPLRK